MSQKRQPKGIPVGGQFAENQHDEASSMLSEKNWGSLNVREGSRTPWGTADHVTIIADGITFAGTPGHGGVKLSPERNAAVPPALRESSGWYEEDVEYNIPAYVFPDEFASQKHISQSPEEMKESAAQSIKNWFPEKWEAATGETLEPGESHQKDAQQWATAHKDDFVTTSASGAKTDEDMVVVTARRQADGASEEFLVPRSEYQTRTEGDELGRNGRFVIDPSRHAKLPPKTTSPRPEKTVVKVSGLYNSDGEAVRASGKGADRINADLDKRWRSRDGEVRSFRDILESGVVGKGVTYNGSKKQYAVMGQGNTVFPVSKATWDHLSQVPDTRTAEDVAAQEFSDYQHRVLNQWGGPTQAQRERLDTMKKRLDDLRAEARPAREAAYQSYVNSEEDRERAARVEGQ